MNTWPWFGLTQEYPPPRTDYAWPPFQRDRPVPSAADLALLRATGFDFIRIPVDAGALLAFSGSRAAALFDMVSDAVGMAHRAGLAAIVNVSVNSGTHFYTDARLLGGPDAPGFHDYRDLVGRLAVRLGALDPARTALEPVNEPLLPCGDPRWAAMQIDLLSAARRGAANLPLLATGACGSLPAGLVALDPVPLRRLAPLVFTFHFYEPYVFSHQGAPWLAKSEPMYDILAAVPWPAAAGSRTVTLEAVRRRAAARGSGRPVLDAAEKAVNDYFDGMPGRDYLAPFFDKIAAWATRYAVEPDTILLGEFGALKTDARYTAAAAPDRARYIRDVRSLAEVHGFGWSFCNLFDGLGLMDETSRRLDPPVVAALGLRVP